MTESPSSGATAFQLAPATCRLESLSKQAMSLLPNKITVNAISVNPESIHFQRACANEPRQGRHNM
jgi:hypothetical protein